jgi:hypothetical protein
MSGGRTGFLAVRCAGIIGLLALGACGNAASGLYGSAATEPVSPQLAATDPAEAPARVNMDPDAECPQINVPSGMSSYASYAGEPGPATVRFQASVAQFARQCTLNPGNTVTIRVGIEGRVVIGEKGSPGTYPAPLRVWVRDRDGTVIVSKEQHLSVTVPAGETQGTFKIIDDSIVVPITLEKPLRTYEILVGFDAKGAGVPEKKRRS